MKVKKKIKKKIKKKKIKEKKVVSLIDKSYIAKQILLKYKKDKIDFDRTFFLLSILFKHVLFDLKSYNEFVRFADSDFRKTYKLHIKD